MREALAPIPYPIAVLALAGCIGRSAPLAVASEDGSDSMTCDSSAPTDERRF
jgi:hypothetical protein